MMSVSKKRRLYQNKVYLRKMNRKAVKTGMAFEQHRFGLPKMVVGELMNKYGSNLSQELRLLTSLILVKDEEYSYMYFISEDYYKYRPDKVIKHNEKNKEYFRDVVFNIVRDDKGEPELNNDISLPPKVIEELDLYNPDNNGDVMIEIESINAVYFSFKVFAKRDYRKYIDPESLPLNMSIRKINLYSGSKSYKTYTITIPQEIIAKFHLEAGDNLKYDVDNRKGIITLQKI